MNIVLVNTNRIKPPIAPIGLDYVAEVLHAAGHRVKVLDLCWHLDWASAVVDKILRHWLQEGYEAEMLNGADQLPKEKESEADTEE